MIDKALYIVIAFYAASFCLLGVQYTLADVYGIDLQAYRCTEPTDGSPSVCGWVVIKPAITGYIQQDELNQRAANIVAGNFTTNSTFYDRVQTFSTAAAFIAWELVTLMTGTYIFYVMILFGVPTIFVLGILSLYIMLLARAILGYVRGI